MTINERSKFWLVVCLILVAGFLGGVLGNWIFIYMLDKYYGIAAGNYAAAPTSTNIVVRQPSRSVPATGVDAAAIVERSLTGIFPRSAAPSFLPSTRLGQGIIITSDGWLVTVANLTADKAGSWSAYTVIASGKTYDIDRVVADPVSQLTFIRLKQANSLPVRDFVSSHELSFFQPVYGLEWQGVFEAGWLGHTPMGMRSSDTSNAELSVSGLSGRNVVLFDQSGRIAGLTKGRSAIAMDTVRALIDKLLTDSRLERARLGVNYVLLSAANGASQEGALLSKTESEPAVIADSPAERAGLRAGDIITSLDGVQIGSEADLAALVAEYKPGDTIMIGYSRGTEKKQASIKLDPFSEK